MQAALGSPPADPLGDGAAVPSLPGAGDATEEDDGDGAGEAAVPAPEFAPEEPEEPEELGESVASEAPDDPDDVVSPLTAPPAVVPEPPPRLSPGTSSQAVMPAMVTVNSRAVATTGRRRVRTRAR
ncbi:hypothetical protein [Streptomyces sp. NPDC001076]